MPSRNAIWRFLNANVSHHSFILFFFGLFIWLPTEAFSANLTLEQLASQIAEQFNVSPPKANDKFTTALRATSEGKNVIYSFVWNFRLDTPKIKVDQLVSEWKAEMIPQVCQNHLKDEAFKQGLYYTFIYLDTAKNIVTKYIVSRETCANIRR